MNGGHYMTKGHVSANFLYLNTHPMSRIIYPRHVGITNGLTDSTFHTECVCCCVLFDTPKGRTTGQFCPTASLSTTHSASHILTPQQPWVVLNGLAIFMRYKAL